MYRTLQELKESVENLIAQQGEDAPCFAMIFTKDDVCTIEHVDGDINRIVFPIEDAEKVFEDMDDSDYLYEEALNTINDSMRSCGLI